MARRLFELPGSIPTGALVEFFADRECSEPVALSVTASSGMGRLSVVMPRSTLPALYAETPRVFARWSQSVSDVTAGSVSERVFVRPCREVRQMVVSGQW